MLLIVWCRDHTGVPLTQKKECCSVLHVNPEWAWPKPERSETEAGDQHTVTEVCKEKEKNVGLQLNKSVL